MSAGRVITLNRRKLKGKDRTEKQQQHLYVPLVPGKVNSELLAIRVTADLIAKIKATEGWQAKVREMLAEEFGSSED